MTVDVENVTEDEMAMIRGYSEAVTTLMPAAATGDRDAQVMIATKALEIATVQGGGEMLVAARCWSRLAAGHGRREDIFFLVGVLAISASDMAYRGSQLAAAAYKNESLALLQPFANAGDEAAISHVYALMADETEKVVVAIPENRQATAYLACADIQGMA